VIERGRRSNGKIVTLISIPFCIDTVQCKRHDCQYIGTYGIGIPCGIDFTGSNIFNIVFVFDIIIFGSTVSGASVMNDNVLRNDHSTENDFTGFGGRFDLCLRNLRRIFAVECMGRNDKNIFRRRAFGKWTKADILDSSYTG